MPIKVKAVYSFSFFKNIPYKNSTSIDILLFVENILNYKYYVYKICLWFVANQIKHNIFFQIYLQFTK